jgi:hypothetical protein
MENKKTLPKWVKISTLSLISFTAILTAISTFPSCSNSNTVEQAQTAIKSPTLPNNVQVFLNKLQSAPFNYVFSEKKEGTIEGVYTGWNTALERQAGSLDDNHLLLSYNVNTQNVIAITYICNKIPQHPSVQDIDDCIKFLSHFDQEYADFLKKNFQRFLTDRQFRDDQTGHKIQSGYTVECSSQITDHDYGNYFQITLIPVK